MLIAQLSDLHIKAGRKKAYGVVDTATLLEQAIKHLLAQTVRPKAVVVTGDLVDHGSVADYLLLREILAPLLQLREQIACYLIPGNHDSRAHLRRVFRDHDYLFQTPDFIQFSVELGPLRLVALDTVIPMSSHGQLCADRLRWLQTVMLEKTRPTIIAMHHPPFQTGIAHMDLIGLKNKDEFEAIVERYPNIERIICGHLHRSIQSKFGRTVASTAPSCAHQIELQLDPLAPDCFVLEPPGYHLHWWSGARLITHQVVIGNFGDTYPFRESSQLID